MFFIAGLAVIGGVLYAMRGGNYGTESWPNLILRLIWAFGVGLLALYLTGAVFHVAVFNILVFATICLGHGLFMDMGRFKPATGLRTEHEKPITLLIGPEDYNWPFWRRWLHNCVGMSLLGVIRHSPAFVFIGLVPYQTLVTYASAGLLHGPLYELGHQLAKLPVFSRLAPDKHTAYGEHLVGALQFGLLAYLL